MSWAYKYDKKYFDLIKKYPLVPITSRKQHSAALAALNPLFDRKRTKAEDDYFDVLVQLIRKYEDEHTERVSASPQDVLEYLMEMNELTKSDIGNISGMQKSHVSEFLKGKRGLPKNAAALLGVRFKVDPMLFMPKIKAISLHVGNENAKAEYSRHKRPKEVLSRFGKIEFDERYNYKSLRDR